MFTIFKYFLLTMLVFFALQISTRSAQAQAILVLNEGNCILLRGTWTANSQGNFCAMTHLSIPAGTALEIPALTVLDINVDGTLTNRGVIRPLNGGAVRNYGTVHNIGTIDITATGLSGGIFLNFRTVDNDGTINIGNVFTNLQISVLHRLATLNNHNTIEIQNGGRLRNNVTFNNYNIVHNSGTIENTDVLNNSGGTINNNATIDHQAGALDNTGGTINNSGTIRSVCEATISGNAPVGNSVARELCEVDTLIWDGGGQTTRWSESANWSPDALPRPQDTVQFNSTSSKNVWLDLDVNITNVTIEAGFNGTLSFSDRTLSVDGDFMQQGGTIQLENGRLEVSGSLETSGGQFNPGNGRITLHPEGAQTFAVPRVHDLHIGSGPLGYWRFNEGIGNLIVHDTSGNGHTGRLGDGPTRVQGLSLIPDNKGALRFDGVDDFVTLEASRDIAMLVRDFSVAAWIYPTAQSGMHRVISTGRTSRNAGWGFGTLDRGLRFTLYGVRNYDSTNFTLPLDQWTHVAAVLGNNNNVSFYVNGMLAEIITGSGRGIANGTDPLFIGASTPINQSTLNQHWAGDLDEIQVYGYPLSANQISQIAAGQVAAGNAGSVTLGQALTVDGNLVLNQHQLDVGSANSHSITINGNLYATGGDFAAHNGTIFFSGGSEQVIDATGITFNNVVFQNSSQGLVGYWPLDVRNTSVAQPGGGPEAFTTPDETLNRTVGQGQGATRFSGSPLSTASLHFNGINQRVLLGNPGVLNFAGEITLAVWVRPEVFEGTQSILAHGYVLSPRGEVALRIVNGNYQISSWDGVRHAATAPIPAEDLNSWVHLAGTYDGTTWRLYRNGVEIAARQDATGAVRVNGGWAIGGRANGGDRFFRGAIDEVAIYNFALSPAAIANLAGGSVAIRAAAVGEATQDEVSTMAGSVRLLSPLHVAGNMMLEEGILDASDGNHLVTLGGNLMQRNGQFNARNGSMHFNGAAGTTQNIEGVQMTLADVEIGADVTVSTNAAMMRTGELNSQGQIQETRQIDGEGELHYGLSDITFNVTDATDFNTLAVTRVDMHSANAAVTTETGSHWFMDAEGEQYVVDMTLPHNNVNGPGVCQHLGNGEWDYFVDEATEASVTRHDVTALDGEWAVGMTLQDPSGTESTQLFLPLVQR